MELYVDETTDEMRVHLGHPNQQQRLLIDKDAMIELQEYKYIKKDARDRHDNPTTMLNSFNRLNGVQIMKIDTEHYPLRNRNLPPV